MAATNKLSDVVSDDLNYEIWARITKTALEEKGLWDVVENGLPPNPTKVPESAATIEVEQLSKWRELAVNDMKALQILQSSLTDSVFRKTVTASSAKELWDLLKKGNDEAKLGSLEKQFQELRMYDNEPLDLYLNRFVDLVDEFNASENKKSDYELITKLLSSLSWEYDDVPPVIEEFMDPKTARFHDVLTSLDLHCSIPPEAVPHMLRDLLKSWKARSGKWCDVCNKNTHNQEDCPSVRKSGAKKSKPKRGECFECGEQGHYARDCKKKNEEPEHQMLTVTFGDFTWDEDMWMVYTAATDHMTPYEKFFTTLDRTYRGRVGLANGGVMMAEGKGEVQFMKEGKKRVIKNVLFVPSFDRNVLSFGQMAERGYSMQSEGGECTIWDESKKVFAKTRWEERGIGVRLQVIEANTSQNEEPEHQMLTVTCADFTWDEDMWMVYTLASDHMTPHEKYYTTLDRTYRGRVGLANGGVMMAEGKGDVQFMKEGKKMTIKNVLFVPSFNRNVLSVGQLTKIGYSLQMGAGECIIKDEAGKVFAKSRWDERGISVRLQVIEAEHELLTLTMGNLTWDEDMWMVYSAASDHMTPYEKYFTTLDRTYRGRVMLGNGSITMAEGKGDVKVMMKKEKRIIVIKNVLFVPRINRNVLSIGQMTSRGRFSVRIIGGNECIITDEAGKVFAKTMWEETGFALRFQVV